jgi:23S rRNA pseudouridine2605 synthase
MPGRKRPLKTLDRVVSKAGLGSRTQARDWIAAGRVSVNERRVTSPDEWVDMALDRVRVDGVLVSARRRVYVLLHKPSGVITTARDPAGRATVYDLLRGLDTFVSPVGRLDRDTSGLLILTNDNRFAHHVTSPSSHVPKTYRVSASTRLSDDELNRLRHGMDLADGATRPAVVSRVRQTEAGTSFDITITEGRNRQVRRMVEALGARVLVLERIRIGSLAIGSLPPGHWRLLSASEVAQLQPPVSPRTALTRPAPRPRRRSQR